MQTSTSNSLEALYQKRLADNHYQTDNAQLAVIAQMQTLLDQLKQQKKLTTWWRWLPTKNKNSQIQNGKIQGLYLWGGVGRGKTFLIDLLYDALADKRKLRLHFYQFMQEVHASLKEIPEQKNPLEIVAKKFAKRTKILFLDEFFVTDITDAMILYQLLLALFNQRVILVTTSNFEPQQLYHDGLQRDRFLPAIALIETHTKVIEIRGQKDYRVEYIEASGSYHYPHNEQAEELMLQCFNTVACSEAANKQSIKVNDRRIAVLAQAAHVVWFDFKDICQTPRSVTDYIIIAQLYDTILISNIPAFNQRDDIARRFIQLVDEFYDKNVILVVSAAKQANELYQDGRLTFEFNRTASRLLEMQSHQYLCKARKQKSIQK